MNNLHYNFTSRVDNYARTTTGEQIMADHIGATKTDKKFKLPPKGALNGYVKYKPMWEY